MTADSNDDAVITLWKTIDECHLYRVVCWLCRRVGLLTFSRHSFKPL